HLNIPLATGYYVQLASVANVIDTAAEVRQMAFFNNKQVVSFSIYPARGASEVAVAKLVNEKIALFTALHPNIQIKEISNIVDPIINNYQASMQALYEGCILAIIVVWLFLRDWRATFVSATALPLSIIPTFLFMYWLKFSLNGVSLLALTLVIGVLVDDAIVEVENIVRHLTYTKSHFDAAINAAKEIGTAVIATSFTLVAVFLPTAFMGGIPGRVFKQFGLTAAIAILLSLIVARLITPLMAAYIMRSHSLPEEIKVSKFMHKYLIAVKWCLHNKGKTLTLVTLFFISSMTLVMFIPTTFLPADDINQVFLNVQVPPGSKIDNIVRVINLAYDKTRNLKSVKSCYATIGVGVQSGETISADSDVTYGTLVFNLVNSNQRKQTQAELGKVIQNILQTIPGAKFYGGEGSGERYSLILASADGTLLHNTALLVEKQMHAINNIGNINSDYNTTRPEIFIKPRFNKSAELGVTPENIGQVIRVATMGDFTNNLAKLDLDSRQIPIKVKLDKTAMQSLDGINNLRIRGNRGTVPLSNVADISLGNGPVNISRYDRSRSVTFNIDLHGRNISEVDHEINQLPIMKHLPSGVYRVASGDMENMNEMFGNFILAMVTGIICVFFILMLLFNDVKQPITILAALPLAISGAISGMMLFGYSFSMSSLIGILMLMGIVTKNSILLVDYILKSIREGKNKREAILEACRTRSRPIIMTTIAMIAGMIPVAFGWEGSGGDSFKVPMAVTVISGLITSTLLSLLVIPVIFEIIDSMSFKNIKKLIKCIYTYRL
nr:efflux RND transporter permease subunit [Burkholderiales bacterium]